MKIQIEFDSSHEATLVIDGRELKYGYAHGSWGFDDNSPSQDEMDNTVGGIVAQKIAGTFLDILQGWLPDEQNPKGDCWGTWEKMTESAADEVYNRVRP